MSMDPREVAHQYLAPGDGSFWKWSDDAEAIEWRDGTTIAFGEEVFATLTRFSPGALPPFDAIVLVLAMCRDEWPEDFAAFTSQPLEKFRIELDEIQRMLKPAVAKVLLGGKGGGSEVSSELVMLGIAQGFVPEALALGSRKSLSLDECLAIITETALEELDPEALRLLHRTGIEADVLPADLDPPTFTTARELIHCLRDDPELAGVASLARDLMAAVHVPRAPADPDDLPLGGVSEISVHGPLDRLLISELAHDDDTLMLRIALGEALYLRREAPPRQPSTSRQILVDTGIRMWGIQRVFATSVALAFAATADSWTRVEAFAACDERIERFDVLTRAGVEEQLSRLGLRADPAAAWSELLASRDEPCDAILVTHERSLPDIERAQPRLPAGSNLFVATINAAGDFALWELGPRGRKEVCKATLDLSRLLRQRPVPKLRADPNLPASFSVSPFPLLLPFSPILDRTIYAGGRSSIVSHTRYGQVMEWPVGSDKGARQVAECSSTREFVKMTLSDDEESALVLFGDYWKLELARVGLDDGSVEIKELDRDATKLSHVQPAVGRLLLIYRVRAVSVDVETLAPVDEIEIPGDLQWVCQNYFRTGDRWYALGQAGSSLCFDPVEIEPGIEYVALFDIAEASGPYALAANGRVYSLATGTPSLFHEFEFPRPGLRITRVCDVSPDGWYLVGEWNGRYSNVLLELANGRWRTAAHRMSAVPGRNSKRVNLYKRIDAVAVQRNELTLVTHKNKMLRFQVGADGVTLARVHRLYGKRVPFAPVDSPRAGPLRLRVAKWPSGARAFVDSRGLLHLASSDPAVADLTIALSSQGEIAGWASSGETFGCSYFLPSDRQLSSKELHERIRLWAETAR